MALAIVPSCGGADSSSLSAKETGTTLSAPLPATLEIAEAGFSEWEALDDRYVSWGVVLDNPTSQAAKDVTLTVRFLGADGAVVGEEVESIGVVPPGRTAWAREQEPGVLNSGEYSFLLATKQVDDIEVLAEVGSWIEDRSDAIEVSEVDLKIGDGYPAEVVHATLKSSSDEDQGPVPVVALFRDAEGAIIGGARWRVDDLPAGESVKATVESREVLVGVDDAEVYVAPPSAS